MKAIAGKNYGPKLPAPCYPPRPAYQPGIENHAAYVASWIKVLKEDRREIFRAASDARKLSIPSYAGRTEESVTENKETADQTPQSQNRSALKEIELKKTSSTSGDAKKFERHAKPPAAWFSANFCEPVICLKGIRLLTYVGDCGMMLT